ncbi:hypothetical protein [Lentibacillus jeotgali]|uniref:hypothetical protein n=1 Tax=Lentibacillus jeotgali TaxID=558169 RepID=UPI00026258A4|nr:hypothetical protein [Lentibacillus jeotgali]
MDKRFTQPYQLQGVDLDIAVALLQKEWQKRYKKVFKIKFDFRFGNSDKIKEMVYRWGYDKTFIIIAGAIRFYPEKWQTEQFKFLSVNQVYTWIGWEVWKMYKNKEFTAQIQRPKI